MTIQPVAETECRLDAAHTVLVLDDLSGPWTRVCRMLRRSGYTVLVGTEGRTARRVLAGIRAGRRKADVLYIHGNRTQ